MHLNNGQKFVMKRLQTGWTMAMNNLQPQLLSPRQKKVTLSENLVKSLTDLHLIHLNDETQAFELVAA